MIQIKICGMRSPQEIKEMDQVATIDYIGFIFYKNSKRYVDKSLPKTSNLKRVGVFVNEELSKIQEIAKHNQLDLIQLHGTESPEFCSKLKMQFLVIKSFGIDATFDFKQLEAYEKAVNYFLFDTKTINHGGSGKLFDWNLLNQYRGNVPFFLSGGLRNEHLKSLMKFKHPAWYGIDLNSGFEITPANKNVQLIKDFTTLLKNKNELYTNR